MGDNGEGGGVRHRNFGGRFALFWRVAVEKSGGGQAWVLYDIAVFLYTTVPLPKRLLPLAPSLA